MYGHDGASNNVAPNRQWFYTVADTRPSFVRESREGLGLRLGSYVKCL